MDLLGLPDDVIRSVLCAMPTFENLIAIVLSCKTVYAIFASTPRTILRAVALNVFGSMHIASAVIRAIRIEETLSQMDESTSISAALCALGPGDSFESTISARYCRALHQRAEVCHRLEVYYSCMFKDRRCQGVTVLTSAEGSVFRMALHNVWLSSFLSARDFDEIETSALSSPNSISTPMKVFLESLSSEEASAFCSVWRWLAWLCDADSATHPTPVFPGLNPDWLAGCVALGLGPAGILGVIESPRYRQALLDARKVTDFHSHALQQILDAAEAPHLLTTQKAISPFTHGILYFDGPSEICERCGISGRYPFWNHENWSHLPLPLRTISAKLFAPGLHSNKYEMSAFIEHLATRQLSLSAGEHCEQHVESHIPSISGLVGELFRLQDAEPIVSRGHKFEDAHLTEDSLLCAPCLGRLIRDRLWAWWLVEKHSRLDDPSLKPDCWHGYDCKIQALPWKDEHRENCNHACAPRHSDIIAAKLAYQRKRAKRAAAKHAAKAQKRAEDGLAESNAPSPTSTPNSHSTA